MTGGVVLVLMISAFLRVRGADQGSLGVRFSRCGNLFIPNVRFPTVWDDISECFSSPMGAFRWFGMKSQKTFHPKWAVFGNMG